MPNSFEFRENQLTHQWVIIAPERARRPDVARGTEPECPFCEGNERLTPKEVFRVGGGRANSPGWQIRVVPNKYPFAPIHEIIIHSRDHNGSFFNYEPAQTERIFRIYRQRYQEHKDSGQVYIFHNHGIAAAESLPHSHTQLAVIPNEIVLDIPLMGVATNVFSWSKHFEAFCPDTSEWPYEVWIAPKERGRVFGQITSEEISDVSRLLQRILKKLEKNLRPNLPFNYYIYQGGDWYLRIIPRVKIQGSFELGTGISVNTVDPATSARNLGRG